MSILEKVWLPFQLPQSDEDVTPGGHASNHGNERLIATASIGNHNIKLEQARFNDSSEYPVIRTESHIGLNLVSVNIVWTKLIFLQPIRVGVNSVVPLGFAPAAAGSVRSVILPGKLLAT